MSEVRRLCDRVGIIRNGRLVTVEPVASLLDRSGKVVRIRATESLSPSAFDLEGVHELEMSETTVTDDSSADDTAVTECTFTFTGDVNALLERLGPSHLLDLSIEEAPLEDVFMRFYGGDSESTDATDATDRPQAATDSEVSNDA